jgi:hypothetical protein
MAFEVRFAVTQPFHGPGGELLYNVGDLLDPAKVPDGAAGRMVAVEVPDKPKRAPVTGVIPAVAGTGKGS